jgi:hypothetical protein
LVGSSTNGASPLEALLSGPKHVIDLSINNTSSIDVIRLDKLNRLRSARNRRLKTNSYRHGRFQCGLFLTAKHPGLAGTLPLIRQIENKPHFAGL